MSWMIVAIVGAILVLASATLAFREHRWLRQASIAEGTVVELIASRGRKGSTTYTPRVSFTGADRSVHTFTRSYGSSPAEFSVREHVLVAYDPQTHAGRILTFGQRFGPAAVLGSVGLGALIMSLLFLFGREIVPRVYLR